MNPTDPILEARGVRFGFKERPDFLGPIDLAIRPGEFWGLIGPNGAGKTTLLRLLAGTLRPAQGEVRLGGYRLEDLSRRERARSMAHLPQMLMGEADATPMEVVLMGRFPHRSFGLFESAMDIDIARQAMGLTETLPFAERALGTLSGGEAQRVHLAAALAQKPRVFLLDEPTSALDLSHQLAVFDVLRRLTQENHLATVVVTHDLNLAGRHCNRLALMDEGRVSAYGPIEDVLTRERLEPVYGVRFEVHRTEDGGLPWLLPQRRVDAPAGDRGRA